MRALAVSGSSNSYSGSALMLTSLAVGCWPLAVGRGTLGRACSANGQRSTANVLIVVLVLLLLVERRIFERHFLARFQSLEDFDAAVVGEAGDDHALFEELLPGVLVLLAVARGPFGFAQG